MNLNVHDLFPSRYLRGEEIQGHRVTVTIERITLEEMGREKEKHPVLWFAGKKKGMVLKKTNAFIIGKLYGPKLEAWIGKRIQLYTKRASAFGTEQVILCVAELVPPPEQGPKTEVEFKNKPEREAERTPDVNENPWEPLTDDLEGEETDEDIPY